MKKIVISQTLFLVGFLTSCSWIENAPAPRKWEITTVRREDISGEETKKQTPYKSIPSAISPVCSYGSDDLVAQKNAEKQLYALKRIGDKIVWVNPKNGSHNQIILIDVLNRLWGNECRKYEASCSSALLNETKEFYLCKNDAGEWVETDKNAVKEGE